MAVLEDLTEEECYLYSIISDESGLDLAEFCWIDYENEDNSLCWRAWPFQWAWFRTVKPLQVDQCLAEGTLVLTERGQVPIEDVQIGDLVLTHKGRWQPVTYKWDRGEQPVVNIKGHGHPGLVATADHKFWINKTWKVPEPHDRWETPWHFPCSTVPPLPSRTYLPGSPCNVPKDVTDPAFLWLYGLFVAEGSCSSSFGKGGTVNRVTFSVHEDEVEEVETRLSEVGLRCKATPIRGERCCNIVVNSRPLATWFSEHGGRGARRKHLAPWVFGLQNDQRLAVLDGLAFGDGYARPNGKVEYSTVSKALAVDVKLLASSCGYFVTWTHTVTADSEIAGRVIRGGDKFVVGWHITGLHNSVKSITPAGIERVYDLEVANDHSFVAESIVVSNCGRSVGKSLSIKMRAFIFPFLHSGQEMVITAPELNHLTPIVSLVENLFLNTRLGREMLPRGRNNGITHRPFQMDFVNGSRILGRIPQRDGKGIKGVHPLWLELDEAQDFPDAGWVEIIETLKRGVKGAAWRAHGVTKGVRDYFFKFTQENSGWHVNRYTAIHRPTWTDQERREKIEQYGSKENPDYRRNVLGLHGDATNPLFVLTRLMACVDTQETSTYNAEEYCYLRVNAEMLADVNGNIDYFLDFPGTHKQYPITWAGMDVGYTNHPSEILVFGEVPQGKGKPPLLKLLTRVHLERIHHLDQVRAIQKVIDFYKVKAFSLDKTGVGLPLFQEMQHANPDLANLSIIKGYNFSGKLTVDIDKSVSVDEFHGDPVKDAAIERNVLEYASDKLREMVDQKLIQLPWDRDLIGEFQGQTYVVVRDTMNQYGKKSYSKGKFHALDAARMAVLGYVMTPMEAYLANLNTRGAVMDLFIGSDDFQTHEVGTAVIF